MNANKETTFQAIKAPSFALFSVESGETVASGDPG
jgi:hypothetical protein